MNRSSLIAATMLAASAASQSQTRGPRPQLSLTESFARVGAESADMERRVRRAMPGAGAAEKVKIDAAQAKRDRKVAALLKRGKL